MGVKCLGANCLGVNCLKRGARNRQAWKRADRGRGLAHWKRQPAPFSVPYPLPPPVSVRIYGNRPLKTLSGLDTRPTAARVRSATFDIWQGAIADCRWLDLCAGIGSMGAEALGRGAAYAVAVERSGRACGVIRENWLRAVGRDRAGSPPFRVLRDDVVRGTQRLAGETFDRIYFDPPYGAGLYDKTLAAIAAADLLAADGELAVEHDPRQWTPATVPGLTLCRQKTYGNTSLAFYRRTD